MSQEINLIISIVSESLLESEICSKNDLESLKLSQTDKISSKNGINLSSHCENCSKSIIFNIYFNGTRKFQTKPDEIKEDEAISEQEWEEPHVLIKEEPFLERVSKTESHVLFPGINYQLPADLPLPPLDNIKAPFFAEMTNSDGSKFYIEQKRQKSAICVTNYDPRVTFCDICSYEVIKLEQIPAHRQGHFFSKTKNGICRGCGFKFSADEQLNHTFFCSKKDKIQEFICTECDFEAKDSRKLRTHVQRMHGRTENEAPKTFLDEIQPVTKKKVKKVGGKDATIDEYLSYLSLPENCVLPNLYKLSAQHSRMHPQPDGTSIYVGKGTNHLQVMNFDPRREKCELCGKSQLKNKPDLIAHRFKEHFFPSFAGNECQGCHKEFHSSESKIVHSHFCIKKSQILVNFCRKCNEQFSTYPKYVSHIKKVHNGDGIEQKYMCHLCSSTFERPTQLELHVIKHKDPKPFKCAHCDAEYKGRHGLETHLIRIHFPHEAKFTCNVCQPAALFGSNEQYKTHLNIVHFMNSKEKQECPHCKKMIRKLGLAHHIRQQHTNTGPKEKFECPSCNKIFFNKKGLDIHSVIHLPEDQRQFRCRFCGRSFNFKQHLVAHERSHTGEKPFKCDTCGKAFARKQALTDHQREHTGQGYVCSVCSRVFTDRGNYRHHMKQHESQMGVKLTFNHEERRLMRLKVLTAEQALKGGLNDDFS